MHKLVVGAAVLILAALSGLAQAASPYPQSTLITDMQWDVGSYRWTAQGSDIWPITWADEGASNPLITAWGDGTYGCAVKASYGVAAITSDQPSTTLSIRVCGPGPMNKGKMMAIVAAGGQLFARVNPQSTGTGAQVWRSTDGGRSWGKPASPLSFLIDSFVQFGRANAGAPGGYLYALESRGTGLNLLRVRADSAQKESSYEYFSGSADSPAWSSSRSAARSIFDNPEGVARPSITYVPGLNRYLLAASHSTVKTPSGNKVGIFEAPSFWGPWKTVMYTDRFLGKTGGHFLSVNFPIKWQDDDGKTLWATFSCHNVGTVGACGQYHDRLNLMKVTLEVGGTVAGPTATADAASTAAATEVKIAVLANDTGTNLTIPSVTKPADGDARINTDKTITYAPDAGFSGTDSFSYTIRDSSGRTDIGAVTITVLKSTLPVITIGSATYASTKACDATAPVGKLCNGKTSCTMAVSNSLCGDPQPWTKKTLSVSFTCGSQSRTASGLEGTNLAIRC